MLKQVAFRNVITVLVVSTCTQEDFFLIDDATYTIGVLEGAPQDYDINMRQATDFF